MKINLSPERVFVSSDFHAYHKNLCKGSTSWENGSLRDFPDEYFMTDKLVDNINAKVGEDDILIHLGDWSFGGRDKVKRFRDRINCKNIIAQAGNHDAHIIKDKELQKLFTKWYGDSDVSPIVRYDIGGQIYICSHYAMRIWENSHHGWRHLYGHSHNSLPDDPHALAFDIGMDAQNLSPLSFVEVEKVIAGKEYKPVDHHNSKTT